jgi:hypothetical protein
MARAELLRIRRDESKMRKVIAVDVVWLMIVMRMMQAGRQAGGRAERKGLMKSRRAVSGTWANMIRSRPSGAF